MAFQSSCPISQELLEDQLGNLSLPTSVVVYSQFYSELIILLQYAEIYQ